MRPRKPYGPNPPGRLPATMIKVLAAELSDQGRLSRGKRYWAENAVTDLMVGHGAVTAEIQGSRPEPYVVTIETTEGAGVPGKRDVWISCTCPDDGAVTEACKHAVAALFALSDEVAIEPELIDRWRSGARRRARAAAPESGLAEVVPIRRDLAPTATPRPDAPRRTPPPEPIDPVIEELGRLLGAPNGAGRPDFPDAAPIAHAGIRDRQLADVLVDAIAHLAINWD